MFNQNNNTSTNNSNNYTTIKQRMTTHINRMKSIVDHADLQRYPSERISASKGTKLDVDDIENDIKTYKITSSILSCANLLVVKAFSKLDQNLNKVDMKTSYFAGDVCDCETLRSIANKETTKLGTGITLTKNSYDDKVCSYNITKSF